MFFGVSYVQELAEIVCVYFDVYLIMNIECMEFLLVEDVVFLDCGSFDVLGGFYYYEGCEVIIVVLIQF